MMMSTKAKLPIVAARHRKGEKKPLFVGKLVIAEKADMPAFGAYLSPSFTVHRGLICLNLGLMAISAHDQENPGEDFKHGFEDVLAHELLHVAQEVYGRVFTEKEVETALEAARGHVAKHGSPLGDDPQQYIDMLQEELDLTKAAIRTFIATLPADIVKGKAFKTFRAAVNGAKAKTRKKLK
jgi:hypothetical protein